MASLLTSRPLLTPLDQPIYQHLHIIDGTALVVRAFFKDRNYYYFTPSGAEVGAILFFFDLLNTVISNACIPNVVIVFDDKGGSNYRRELYPEYKKNRPPVDPFLLEQMIMIRQLTESLGYSVISSNQFEADDVIATLCHSNLAHYYYIESKDKDFAQLLKYNNIFMLDSFNRKFSNYYTGFDKFGVDCRYAVDFQALCGDTADNIPGVKGIASTTAKALINEFGSLEQIYAVAEAGKMIKISRFSPQNITKKLLESKDNAFLSYNLASLVTDINLPLDSLNTCHQLDLDLDKFFKYTQAYELYELRSSLKNKTLGYPYIKPNNYYDYGSYIPNLNTRANTNTIDQLITNSSFDHMSGIGYDSGDNYGFDSLDGYNYRTELQNQTNFVDHSDLNINYDSDYTSTISEQNLNLIEQDLYSPDQWIKCKKKYPLLSKNSKIKPIPREHDYRLEEIKANRQFSGPIE